MGDTLSDEGESGPGTGLPRWVKVSGIVLAAVVVLLAVVLLFSGGRHGPGRHFGGLPAAQTASTSEMTSA